MLSESSTIMNGGCDTYRLNIIKYKINKKKKLKFGLFFSKPYLNLSYCFKFKSEQRFNNTKRKEVHFSPIFFTLVSIYIAVTHTFPTFLDLKGGLFF